MRYLISNIDYSDVLDNTWNQISIDVFHNWLRSVDNNELLQIDTETTMVPFDQNAIEDRELLLMQVGSNDGLTQYVLDWTVFSELDKYLLESHTFVAHNARFEYIVLKSKLDITLENIHDTYLMSKVLNTGLTLEKGYHSLAGCLNRFFKVPMSKEMQTKFVKEKLTIEHLDYAADDVVLLVSLFDKLKTLLDSWNLYSLYSKVERHVMKVYADMSLNPIKFDESYWENLSEILIAKEQKLKKELDNIVLADTKLVAFLKTTEKILDKNLVIKETSLTHNWASNIDRKKILSTIIPELNDINKFTKPELKKLYKSNTLENKSEKLLKLYLDRNYSTLDRYLAINYRDWLIENGYYQKEGQLNINWNSPIDRLVIFKQFYPNLKDTNAKTLKRIHKNALINKYKEYVTANKMVTTYGPKFKEKYVDRHGMIAPTDFSQILSTGRVAAGILLQMPGKSEFRNGFLPPRDDYVFVDSDYASAELLIMSYLSGEEAFLNAIKEKKDLHMLSASLIFEDKWKSVAEPGCVHLQNGSRCECEEHNKLRTISKSISFGLAYGLTHIGLAERLDISRKEAKELVDKFFNKFTKLQGFFKKNADFGAKNNYIISSPPTNRIRFFFPPNDKWEIGSIERQSMNFPIQETNASMLKIALIKLRKYIIENDFPAILHLPIHDEILSSCHKSVAKEWKGIQENAMMEAADLFLEKGLLTVDTKITDKWTK